jgi:excinuclease ABC subunit C
VRGDTDDLAAMTEVLRRRFSRYLEAAAASGDFGSAGSDAEPDGTDGDTAAALASAPVAVPPELNQDGNLRRRYAKFAYPPQLLVVDGGAPQVQVAAAVLAELGIDDIAVCGLAKRLEEVWLPGDEYPVILPRTSEALYLLQRVRDEAHRFAITFHRERRSKRMTASTLDSIAGLGEIRRKTLLTRFGSLKRLAAASVEEIESVPGIGRRTAESIVAAVRGETPDTGAADTEGAAADPAATPVVATPPSATGRSVGEAGPEAAPAEADDSSRST